MQMSFFFLERIKSGCELRAARQNKRKLGPGARPEKIGAQHTMRARISTAAAASPSEGLINKFKQMCRGSLFNRGKNEPPAWASFLFQFRSRPLRWILHTQQQMKRRKI